MCVGRPRDDCLLSPTVHSRNGREVSILKMDDVRARVMKKKARQSPKNIFEIQYSFAAGWQDTQDSDKSKRFEIG